MVSTVVQKVMENSGKIDGFNSSPESDEKRWENWWFQQWSRKLGKWLENCWFVHASTNDGLPWQNGWFQKMINALGKLDAFKSGPQTH